MSGCNATVERRNGLTAQCGARTAPHDGLHEDYLDGVVVLWHDRCKGAKPHTPPGYRARLNPTGDGVVTGPDADGWVALYHWERHPDPLGSAEALAARLNGEDDADWIEQIRLTEIYLREADTYRAALEKIKELACSGKCTHLSHSIREIAREALEGGR